MTVMDPVSSLVDDFDPGIGPLTVERRVAPTQNEFGGWDASPAITFQLSPVAAHNVSGRDLDQVPEADRNSEIVQFYARDGSFPAGIDVGFRVSDQGYGADVVLYEGRRYRIVTVRNFSPQGRVWCAMGALEDVQARP